MNLCQPNPNFSCGACCGILNLNLNKQELSQLLKERTQKFKEEVDFSKNWTIVAYRQTQERRESSITKIDPTTYVCPFLGYIDSEEKKIGCMIHPSISGDPLSQNFSFYGASICQGYDCKNKQSPQNNDWMKFISKLKLNSIEYSQLAGDIVFWKFFETFLEKRGWTILEFSTAYNDLFQELIYHKLKHGKQEITSFEMNFSSDEDLILNSLASWIGISLTDKLYKKLEGVKPRAGALR